MKRSSWMVITIMALLLFPINFGIIYGHVVSPPMAWDIQSRKIWDVPTSAVKAVMTPGGGVTVYVKNVTFGDGEINIIHLDEDLTELDRGTTGDKYSDLTSLTPLGDHFDYGNDLIDIVYHDSEVVYRDYLDTSINEKLNEARDDDNSYIWMRYPSIRHTDPEFHFINFGGVLSDSGPSTYYIVDTTWNTTEFVTELHPFSPPDSFISGLSSPSFTTFTVDDKIIVTFSGNTSGTLSIIQMDLATDSIREDEVATPDLGALGIRGLTQVHTGVSTSGVFSLVEEYDLVTGTNNVYVISEDNRILARRAWKDEVTFAVSDDVGGIDSVSGHPFVALEKRLYREPWENVTLGYLVTEDSVVDVTVHSGNSELNVTKSPKVEYVGAWEDRAYFLVSYDDQIDLAYVQFSQGEPSPLSQVPLPVLGLINLVTIGLTTLYVLKNERRLGARELYPSN